MSRYLIDANLPCKLSLWDSDNYVYVRDLNESMSDTQIWQFAHEHSMIIVTKDADFSHRIMLSSSAYPKVVHIRFGNVKMNEFYSLINRVWWHVEASIVVNRMISVYSDRIECID